MRGRDLPGSCVASSCGDILKCLHGLTRTRKIRPPAAFRHEGTTLDFLTGLYWSKKDLDFMGYYGLGGPMLSGNPVFCSQASWHAVTACAYRPPGENCLGTKRIYRDIEFVRYLGLCSSLVCFFVLDSCKLVRKAQRSCHERFDHGGDGSREVLRAVIVLTRCSNKGRTSRGRPTFACPGVDDLTQIAAKAC